MNLIDGAFTNFLVSRSDSDCEGTSLTFQLPPIERLHRLEASLGDALRGVWVDGGQRGVGYGIPTKEMLDALRTMAGTEGSLLDPVCSARLSLGCWQTFAPDVVRLASRTCL